MEQQPFISILVPCRNESRFIRACLESILANDYPRDRFEVLVIDGMSTDDTRGVVAEFAAREPNVILIDNPSRITAAALNIGIQRSRGDLTAWMSAHNEYQHDYLAICARYHAEYEADNVGGVIVTRPRDSGIVGRAIGNVLTHPFGVGPSHFRINTAEPRWTDTVFGGCYRRTVFERIGLFNERLVRGQDMEFNLRMRRAGMRTLLVPEIRSVYNARSRFGEFISYNWTNGVWTLKPFLHSVGMPVRLRHLVPMFFVATLFGLLVLCAMTPLACKFLVAVLGLYFLIALTAAIQISVRKRAPIEGLVTLGMFPALHLSFGAGCIAGLASIATYRDFWVRVAGQRSLQG